MEGENEILRLLKLWNFVLQSAVSSHSGDVLFTLVQSASETLANIVSKKLSNSSLLSAVVKVKLETIITESAVEMDCK